CVCTSAILSSFPTRRSSNLNLHFLFSYFLLRSGFLQIIRLVSTCFRCIGFTAIVCCFELIFLFSFSDLCCTLKFCLLRIFVSRSFFNTCFLDSFSGCNVCITLYLCNSRSSQ